MMCNNATKVIVRSDIHGNVSAMDENQAASR